MTNGQKQFFLRATVLLAIVIAVSHLLFSTIFETNNFPLRIISVCIVWLATCASCIWVMKTVNEKPKAFVRVFMLQTTVKLLLYMVYIIVYLLIYRQHGVPFAVHFLVVYFVFTVLEVLSILIAR